MTPPGEGRAVVVGASMAGLFAARALSGRMASVVVYEADRLDGGARPRAHVPQGRHLHLLLASGLDVLREWFPGVEEQLRALGAVETDGSGAWVHQGGAYRARGDWGRPALCVTRPLLEHVVRERVAALDGVEVVDDTTVSRTVVSGGRVRGVEVDGAVDDADLVVDCSGRNSRIVRHLAASGALVPTVTRVGIDIAYSSFFLERREGDFEGDFVLALDDRGSFRGGVVLPVEQDRWHVNLSGVHGDVPPTDDDGIRAFAASLPSPAVALLVDRCRRVSPAVTHRFPSSPRRHFEATHLPGLVVLGDAASSFNPVYGQGMSSAALQTKALGGLVEAHGAAAAGLARRVHRETARIIDGPWRIAVGADLAHPATVGDRSRETAVLNRWVRTIVLAAHVSVLVARTFNRVLQLSEPPAVLLHPATVARVLRSFRSSPALTGAPIRHPSVGPSRPV